MNRLLLLLILVAAQLAHADNSPIMWQGSNSKDLSSGGLITPKVLLPSSGTPSSTNRATLVAPALAASRTLTTPAVTTTLAGFADNLSVFAATTSSELAGVISNETGTGALCFADTPTLVAPILGTPTSGTLTNTTGFPAANLSGLGAGIATFLANPTSANLAAALTNETGSGGSVFADTPTLITPVLGVATATSINKVAITAPATTATLAIANNKTLTVSNSVTFSGTDSSTVAFGAGGTIAYILNKLDVFAATTSAELASVLSDEQGSGGGFVRATSPTITTATLTSPVINTPSSSGQVYSGTATCTGTDDTSNITTLTSYTCQYARLGSLVFVSGKFTIDPAAAGVGTRTRVRITLPIVTNITATEQCGGTGVGASSPNTSALIFGDATNESCNMEFFTTADVSSNVWAFSLMYLIN